MIYPMHACKDQSFLPISRLSCYFDTPMSKPIKSSWLETIQSVVIMQVTLFIVTVWLTVAPPNFIAIPFNFLSLSKVGSN